MALEKKHYIIAGALGLGISVAAGAAYLHYKKMMNYQFKIKGVNIVKITKGLISFDVLLDFINKSNLSINVLSIITKVYVNDKYLLDVVNKPFVIQGNSTSPIDVNINFKPSDITSLLSTNYASLILAPEKIAIRADIKMKVKLWMFKVNIAYSYSTTLKQLITKKPAPAVSNS